MKRVLALVVSVLALSLSLAACGGSGDTNPATEASTSAETSTESSTAEERIKRIEQETKEAELEAAIAKKEAAQQAAKARKAAAKRATAAKAKAARAVEQEEESTVEAPDVVGMRLPEAESVLRSAGLTTQAENTDTTFGIMVPSHYTICTQSEPHGNTVTVLAQKYGC